MQTRLASKEALKVRKAKRRRFQRSPISCCQHSQRKNRADSMKRRGDPPTEEREPPSYHGNCGVVKETVKPEEC